MHVSTENETHGNRSASHPPQFDEAALLRHSPSHTSTLPTVLFSHRRQRLLMMQITVRHFPLHGSVRIDKRRDRLFLTLRVQGDLPGKVSADERPVRSQKPQDCPYLVHIGDRRRVRLGRGDRRPDPPLGPVAGPWVRPRHPNSALLHLHGPNVSHQRLDLTDRKGNRRSIGRKRPFQ